MRIPLDTIDWYLSRGYSLMPLSRPDNKTLTEKVRGKRPLHSNWTNKQYTRDDIIKYARHHNLGCRLGPLDMVLDIDPRNGGDEGLAALEETLGISDLHTQYPSVITGSGGYHIYTKIPFDTHMEHDGKFREVLPDYPGVEFKSCGRQVVIPGSYHAAAQRKYLWDIDSNYLTPTVPYCPSAIFDLISFVPLLGNSGHTPGPKATPITPGELAEVLEYIPVDAYTGDHSSWFGLMAACYHATEGEGSQVFIEWSTSDPAYANDGFSILKRWKSLGTPSNSMRSLGTLVYELKRFGAPVPQFLGHNRRYDYYYQPISRDDADMVAMLTDEPSLISVRAKIDDLCPTSFPRDIQSVIHDIAFLPFIEKEDAIASLSNQVNRPATQLKISVATVIRNYAESKNKKIDPTYDLGMYVLKTRYDNGGSLLTTAGDDMWEYNGRYWLPLSEASLRGVLSTAIDEFVHMHPGLKVTYNQLLSGAMPVIKSRTSNCKVDFFRINSLPPSVVNCDNCEIHIDIKTGRYDVREHTPSSYLTSVLPIRYDSDAKCPLWDTALSEIFSPLPDAEDVIRHVWEIFGYTLQPVKNLKKFFFFHGPGNDGKSTILNILMALLGPSSYITKALNDYDISKNKHAYDPLVGKLAAIDDDLAKNTILPDSFIKKISQNTQLSANPKFGKEFQFLSFAAALFAGNHYPISPDMGKAIQMRANIIPCVRHFSRAEMDIHLVDKVTASELPGVLNRSLEGLTRLRQRGDFIIPKSCEVALERWIHKANQVSTFLDDVYTPVDDTFKPVKFKHIWEEYKDWVIESGIRRSHSRSMLEGALYDLGYPITTKNNVKYIKGLQRKEGEG